MTPIRGEAAMPEHYRYGPLIFAEPLRDDLVPVNNMTVRASDVPAEPMIRRAPWQRPNG
jgi:hypothetical protein